MLESAVDLDTPLTKKLGEIGKYITIGVIAVSAVILTVGVYRALGRASPWPRPSRKRSSSPLPWP